MLGYYNQPEATREAFCDEWIKSGDIAFLADGEIYPVGRKKELIIKAGRNFIQPKLKC